MFCNVIFFPFFVFCCLVMLFTHKATNTLCIGLFLCALVVHKKMPMQQGIADVAIK